MNFGVLLQSLKIFFGWILLLFLFVLAGGLVFGDLGSISMQDLANWDGRHFLDIAENGYTNKIQYAFFPLYPLSINFAAILLNMDYLYASLLINLLALLGSINIFLKLSSKYTQNSLRALLYLLIFPTSFYLIMAYSEGLFLLLILLTFFWVLRKNYLLAALFASMSSLTRISGIAVILALSLYIIASKLKFNQKIMAILISLSGLILYGTYLYFQTGNPVYFLVSELSWGRSLEVPGSNVLDAVSFIVREGIKPESYTIFSDLFFTVFGLGLALRVFRFLKPPLSTYTALSLLIPLSTALILSVPRFLIVIFPIFIIISKINNRIFNVSYVIISLVLLFLYFNFFLRNIWVS